MNELQSTRAVFLTYFWPLVHISGLPLGRLVPPPLAGRAVAVLKKIFAPHHSADSHSPPSPRIFPHVMCPGQSAGFCAPRGGRVSHGASFLAPGSLARRRHERVIHHHLLVFWALAVLAKETAWAFFNREIFFLLLGFGIASN